MDIHTVVKQISNILRGQPELIGGFNRFMPPEYRIVTSPNDDDVRAIEGHSGVTFTTANPNRTPRAIAQPSPWSYEMDHKKSLYYVPGNAIYEVVSYAGIRQEKVNNAIRLWSSAAYTIHTLEWLSYSKKKPLLADHSSREAFCLDSIIRFCGTSLNTFDKDAIRANCLGRLNFLLDEEFHNSMPECCLDMDAFDVLAVLVLSMPVLFERVQPTTKATQHPFGTTLNKYSVHLMLTFNFVQVLLTYPFQDKKLEIGAEFMCSATECAAASVTYEAVRTAAGLQLIPALPGSAIVQCLKSCSLHFLRCAAMFFHVLTDTPPPSALQELSNKEFESLCNYLELPSSLDQLLISPTLKQLATSWAGHPRVLKYVMNLKADQVQYPLPIVRLIPLPSDYSDLISRVTGASGSTVSMFSCRNSEGDHRRFPTMCLVCGEVLCSARYCCQGKELGSNQEIGSCTRHMYFCGMEIGIFLSIRDCKILLRYGEKRGCFYPPPYVDEYGETDEGLLSGNPLHLCHERYEALNSMWLGHNIPEQVSYTMEKSIGPQPNWQLM